MQDLFNQFFAKYNGQGNVGDTPENTGQCVGLIEVWIDFLHLPHIWGNAEDLLNNSDPKFFQIILNDPTNSPQCGDVVVISRDYNGTVGHTGIATGIGDNNHCELFEQNDPLGGVCQKKTYPYNNPTTGKSWIVGWMRPILHVVSSNTPQGGLPANYDEIIGKAAKYDEINAGGYVDLAAIKAIIDNLTQARDNNQHAYEQEVETNKELAAKIQELTDTNHGLTTNISEVQKQNADLSRSLAEQNTSDSTAIDAGIEAQKQRDAALSDLNKIAAAMHTTYPAVANILTVWADAQAQIAKQQQAQDQQLSYFQKYLKVFIDLFVKKK